MKKLILTSLCVSLGLLLSAQEVFRLTNTKVQLAGTSTLHDWTATVTKTTGTATLAFTNGNLSGIQDLSVSMDAKTIKSEKGSTMDKKMAEALKTENHPTITFKLTKVTSLTQKGDACVLNAEGSLTIAGVTKPVNLIATGKKKGLNTLVFYGTQKLKMTDFKVSPPVMFLGTLKTGDEVTITFETTLSGTSGFSQN